MYISQEELLRVEDAQGVDALAQRALKVAHEARKMAGWAILLVLHREHPFPFIETAKSKARKGASGEDPFEMMPVMVGMPNRETIVNDLAENEECCAYWRERVPPVVFNN